MSYADRHTASQNDAEYAKLKVLQTRVEEVTQDWMNRATALHGVTVDTDDKAELLALRVAFKASLATILA